MLDRWWLLTVPLLSSPSPLFCLTPSCFLSFLSSLLVPRSPYFLPSLCVVFVFCSRLFTNPQPAVHSLASPSHCSFSVQGSKTLQSKSLVNSYYSGTDVHARVHRNTLTGIKSCRPEAQADPPPLGVISRPYISHIPEHQ